MNKILNNEINHIKEYFDNANISRISVILTGSVARGEDHWGDGGYNSDLDILVVIENLEQLDYLREQFESLNMIFRQTTSFIFTLKENFIFSKDRGYVRSIKSINNILYDNLEIKNFLLQNLSTSIEREEKYRSYFQEFCYYYSKWIETKDLFQKKKALKSWRKICHMVELPYIDDEFPTYNMVVKIMNKIHTPLLPSSQKFLSIEFYGKKGTFNTIQNMLHLENQGIEFSRSSIRLKEHEN